MKFNFKYLYFLLIALVVFACRKNNEDITTVGPVIPKEKIVNNLIKNLKPRSGGGLDLGCFIVKYPFGMVTQTGDTITIESEDDFNDLLNNPAILVIDFVYPLDVDKEVQVIAIHNIEEMSNLYASCIPTGGWSGNEFPAYLLNFDNSCYKFVYPVSLVSDQGVHYVAANEAELADYLAANPLLFFEWPLTLEKQDNTQHVAHSADELLQLLLACDNITGPGCDTSSFGKIACFDIVFPISLKLIDGTTATANSSQELISLILNGNAVGFNFPIQITSAATGNITVNSEHELDQTINEHCGGGPSTGQDLIYYMSHSTEFGGTCYDIVFPLTVAITTTQTQVINNMDELINAFNDPATAPQGLMYPVSMKLSSNGTVVTVNSVDELFDTIKKECY